MWGKTGSMEKNGWFAITGVNSTGQEYSNWYFAAGDGDIIRDGWREMDGHSYYFDKIGLIIGNGGWLESRRSGIILMKTAGCRRAGLISPM